MQLWDLGGGTKSSDGARKALTANRESGCDRTPALPIRSDSPRTASSTKEALRTERQAFEDLHPHGGG